MRVGAVVMNQGMRRGDVVQVHPACGLLSEGHVGIVRRVLNGGLDMQITMFGSEAVVPSCLVYLVGAAPCGIGSREVDEAGALAGVAE